MDVRELPTVLGEHVEVGVVDTSRRPVPADHQVGTQPTVQRGAVHEVVDAEPVLVLEVQQLGVFAGHPRTILLVAGGDHGLSVDLERDRRRVERVPWQRVHGQLVLPPPHGFTRDDLPVDGDRVVP